MRGSSAGPQRRWGKTWLRTFPADYDMMVRRADPIGQSGATCMGVWAGLLHEGQGAGQGIAGFWKDHFWSLINVRRHAQTRLLSTKYQRQQVALLPPNKVDKTSQPVQRWNFQLDRWSEGNRDTDTIKL